MNESNLTLAICVYNGEKYIAETLESIEQQTYKEFNVLIIDDCSTDETRNIVQKYSKSNMFKSFTIISLKENVGLAKARSIAMDSIISKYIMFIDADDLLYPEMVNKLFHKIESDNDLMAVGCYVEYIDDGGGNIGGGIFIELQTKCEFYSKAKSEKLIFLPACSIFENQSAKLVGGRAIDGFPSGKPRYQDYCEDLDMWTRMSDLYSEGKAIIVLPEILYKYRKMDSTISSNTLGMMMRMKHIKTNLKRRRIGTVELSYLDFIQTLSKKDKKKIEKEAKSAITLRKAAFDFSNNKYLSAILKSIRAFIISPKYFRDKILPMIRIRYS